MTEIYDYLRILYAHLGIPHDPQTGEVIKSITKDSVVERILTYPKGEPVYILANIEIRKQDSFEDIISKLQRLGFLRIRLNGSYYDIDELDLKSRFDRKLKNELLLVVDRLKVDSSERHRLFEAIETAAKIGNGKLTCARVGAEPQDVFFNLAFSIQSTGESFAEITPHTFAFNHILGMCIDCQGLGVQYGANLTHIPAIMHESVASLLKLLWKEKRSEFSFQTLLAFLAQEKIDPYTMLHELPVKSLQKLMNGSDSWIELKQGLKVRWIGINNTLAKIGRNATTEIKASVIPMLDELECLSCKGARINPLARHVTINDLSINELCHLPIEKALSFMHTIPFTEEQGKLFDEVRKQLLSKLKFLSEVGLHYLSLDRRAPTLSGGEAQRIRLARQLGSGLTGILYVLDEPTIGLHPRDNARLNQALAHLKELGNTLVLVEHDPLTVQTADYILDFGPKSGEHGGHITAQGSVQEIIDNPESLTGNYLSGRLSIPTTKKRKIKPKEWLTIEHASVNNLKDISVKIPIGLLTCLTGVSGSGKSTLMGEVILPAVTQGLLTKDSLEYKGCHVSGIGHFDKILSIDQNPIGQTSRSNVGTYADILPKMRDFFAQLPASKMKGLQGKHFSYNHRSGMCNACFGMGYRHIEMHFLPPINIECEECKGMRLNPISLETTYCGKNFGQYLQMTVMEVVQIFHDHPPIIRPLKTLISVGLGYLKLGQEIGNLSGGEAQRIKLSRELAKRSNGRTLYLLDEPTTGLHSDDIKTLIGVLQKIVDKGNTMIIIEHNADLIKCADYQIELGPEAGEAGGYAIVIPVSNSKK